MSFVEEEAGRRHFVGGVMAAGQLFGSAPRTLSYPIPRKRERSLHTCAQDVQITRMATI
jgi:hypothetical protein